jgi:WD40 repeat protein
MPKTMKKSRLFAALAVLVFLTPAHAARIPSLEGFTPKPIPVIDYSEYQKNAPLEMIVYEGGSDLSSIDDIAFSPDGRLLAASVEGKVMLWNMEGGLLRIIHVISVFNDIVFSPDGMKIAIGGWGGAALVGIDGKVLWERVDNTNSLAMSPDGKLIACGVKHAVKLFSIDGKLLKTFVGHKKFVTTVEFSPDGSMIASGSQDKTVKLWNVATGLEIRTFKGHKDEVFSVAFRPDGKVIASGSKDQTVRLWRTKGGRLKILKGYRFLTKSLAFSPDGSILAVVGGGLYLWNEKDKLIRKHDKSVYGVAFSPDGHTIAAGKDSLGKEIGGVQLFNPELERLMEFNFHTAESPYSVSFSPDGRLIAIGARKIRFLTRDGMFPEPMDIGFGPDSVMFTENGKVTAVRGRHSDIANKYYFVIQNEDGASVELESHGSLLSVIGAVNLKNNMAVTASHDGIIKVWSLRGKLQNSIDAGGEDVQRVAISPDGRIIASGSKNGTVNLWDINGQPLRTMKGHSKEISFLVFSPDGKLLASASEDGTAKLWDINGAELKTMGLGSKPRRMAFSPGGSILAVGLWDSSIKLFLSDGKLLRTLKGHNAWINDLNFSPCGKFLVSASGDETTRIWNIQTGGYVALVFAGKEWILFTHDGYFSASRNGGTLVTMAKGLKAFGVDQFALKSNRPDIILKRLGSKNRELISHYHKLYKKRLRRAGISEEQLGAADYHVPEAKIVGTDRHDKLLDVSFLLSDSKYDLKGYNIYVNDVPIYGAYGKPVSGRTFEKTETVELIPGRNKVEVAAFNEKGVSSHRAFKNALYEKEAPSGLYYIGFGVSKYADESLNLSYADKDAKDLGQILKGYVSRHLCAAEQMKPRQYRRIKKLFEGLPDVSAEQKKYKESKVRIKTYLNEDVTVENIKKAKEFLKDAKVDDVFVLFIAGHGVHDTDDESTYYYLTHDADLKNLPQTAAKFELIEDLLQGIAPRKKLFLMDTCESGIIDEDTEEKYFAMAESRGIKARTSRAIRINLKGEKGKRRAVARYLLDKDRFIYNDLMRRSGAVVFSSSKGSEFSYESSKIKNGFFTEAIMDALMKAQADANNDGYISKDELRDYVSKSVAEQTGGNQHPVVDRDNIYQKFVLPMMD